MTFLSCWFLGRYIYQHTMSPVSLGAVCLTHCILMPLTCWSIVRACGVWVSLCMSFRVFAYDMWLNIWVWRNTTSLTRGHRIYHNAPWAQPTSIICLTPLWLWLTVRPKWIQPDSALCTAVYLQSITIHSITPTWINDTAVSQYASS